MSAYLKYYVRRMESGLSVDSVVMSESACQMPVDFVQWFVAEDITAWGWDGWPHIWYLGDNYFSRASSKPVEATGTQVVS